MVGTVARTQKHCETKNNLDLSAERQSPVSGIVGALMTMLLALSFIGYSAPAQAQNLLANPGFEDNPPSSFGNNVGHSIAPWILGGGSNTNVVRVNGAGAPDLGGSGSFGPQFDAQNGGSGAGASTFQHYLDIADGSNDFFQSFTVPVCGELTAGATSDYTMEGWFSLRSQTSGSGGVGATGTIELRDGNGLTGPAVARSLITVNIPATTGAPDVWTQGTNTISLPQGDTFSFRVSMGNPVNFDAASLMLTSCIIQANDDGPETFSNLIGTTTFSILTNDVLDGDSITPADVTLIPGTPPSPASGSISLNADGTINIAAGTTPGTYTRSRFSKKDACQ